MHLKEIRVIVAKTLCGVRYSKAAFSGSHVNFADIVEKDTFVLLMGTGSRIRIEQNVMPVPTVQFKSFLGTARPLNDIARVVIH